MKPSRIELLKALRPFAAFALHIVPTVSDETDLLPDLTAGDFRRALATIKKAGKS